MTATTPPTFDFAERDRYYWSALEQIAEQQGFKIEDLIRN